MALHRVPTNGTLKTAYGDFCVDIIALPEQQIIVLRTPDLEVLPGRVPLCRIQSECISHMFQDLMCDCANQIHSSLTAIAADGHGLFIYLRQEGMDLGLGARLENSQEDARTYIKACLVLSHYSITSVRLLSLNKRRIAALEDAKVTITERRYAWSEGRTLILGHRIERVLRQVQSGASHPLVPLPGANGKPRVLVLGDLNVDEWAPRGDQTTAKPGGTGFNAAVALKAAEFCTPIIFGRVGSDSYGAMIRKAIADEGIYAFIGVVDGKKTGTVRITPGTQGHLTYTWDKKDNANDYDHRSIAQTLELAQIGAADYMFITSYLFVQRGFDAAAVNQTLRAAGKTGARLILDLTRWSADPSVFHEVTGEHFDAEAFKARLAEMLDGINLYCVIGEMVTFTGLNMVTVNAPNKDNVRDLMLFFRSKWIICRYKRNLETVQYVAVRGKEVTPIPEPAWDRPAPTLGQGDHMFAAALKRMVEFDKLV
jgi:GTP cyclohydrolase II/sugar/nucleoside kinase (ribokinase family)